MHQTKFGSFHWMYLLSRQGRNKAVHNIGHSLSAKAASKNKSHGTANNSTNIRRSLYVILYKVHHHANPHDNPRVAMATNYASAIRQVWVQ